MKLAEGVSAGGTMVRSDFGRLTLWFWCGGGGGKDVVLTGDPAQSPLGVVVGALGRGQHPLIQSSGGGWSGAVGLVDGKRVVREVS